MKTQTMGEFLAENGGQRPAAKTPMETTGLVVETRGQYLARIAAGESAVETKPKRGRKAQAEDGAGE